MSFNRALATMIFLVGFSQAALAQYGLGSDNVGYLGAGLISHNIGRAATNAASGTKPQFGETYTQVSITGKFRAVESWSVSPVLVYAYPGKKTSEGKETTTVAALGVRGFYDYNEAFDFHVGPGVMYYQIKGSGGTVTLNNGSGTSVFGIPSGTKTSTLLYWDFGAGYKFSTYRVDASLLVTGLTNSAKRALTPVITFNVEVL